MVELMTTPLFDLPKAQPLVQPKAAKAAKAGNDKPVWSPYRPKNPQKCDHCVQVLAETSGAGPIARQAKFRRVAGALTLLLCHEHAQLQRDKDGLPGYRALRSA